MIVTDRLKIIDNKIKANQAQYDLDRLAAKISAYSSGDLRKYEYLTGEDLGYKPSVFEQAKFDYSPLGNIFTTGLDKEDQSEAAKNESDFSYDSRYAFYRFDRGFKKFKRTSLGSKYGELKEFYKLLSDLKNHKPLTTETKDRKDRITKNVNQLYNKFFDTYKKNYDSAKVKDEEKIARDYKQFEIIDKKKQKSEWNEGKTKRDIEKPLWFEIYKKEFEELTRNIYNNQDNND